MADTPIKKDPILPHRLVDRGAFLKAEPQKLRLPMGEVLRRHPELLDRYNPKLLNHVIRNLKSMITLRADRTFDLAAKRDAAVKRDVSPEKNPGSEKASSLKEALKEGAMIMRNGKMIPADPETLKRLEKLEKLEKMAAALKPEDVKKLMGMPDSQVSPEQKEALSLFEKVFLARFEGGASLEEGAQLGEGQQAKFAAKSEKAWGEFFQKFLPFTLTKTVPLSEIRALIYRGFVKLQGKGDAKGEVTGELISDLKLASGKTDKFARLEVQGGKVLEELASKMPGDMLATALIAEWIGGPELAYQALSHKVVNPEMAKLASNPAVESYQSPEAARETAIREGVRESTPGIALSARTEQLMAERLDIDLRPSRMDLGSDVRNQDGREGITSSRKDGGFGGLFKKKKKGLLASMMTWEESQEGSVFVPWYQHVFKRKKFPGKVKWWVPLLYFVGFSATVFFVFYVFKYLLPR